MLNKIYDKFIKYIKSNYRFIIGLILIIFLFNYKLDYEIYTYGKPLNIEKRIYVEDSYDSKGDFYLTYVSARPGIIPLILLSYVIPSWDLVSLKNSRIENENYKEIIERGRIELKTVNKMALKNAFEEANIEYSETDHSFIICYVFDDAQTNLKVGDIIKDVNGISIKTYDDLINIIESKEVGDTLFITVISDNKLVNKNAVIKLMDEKKKIGIYLIDDLTIVSEKKVDFNYKNSESGSSGGLMSALYIYNKLTKDDLTKGKKIAGTGTINYDGSIGQIGGIKYKLLGAVKSKADIFIVPAGDNYEEAKRLINDNKYKINLIEASTFKDVISKLKKIN